MSSGFHFAYVYAKSLQSCLIIFDPLDCSLDCSLGFPGGFAVKNPSAMQESQETQVWDDPLEEERATHARTIAWRISWTEEPGKLQSMEFSNSQMGPK